MQATRLVIVILALLAAATSGAHAGAGGTDASAFAVRTVRLLVSNRYSAAWPSLHPSHQRAVGGRDVYVTCEQTAPVVGTVAAIESLQVRDEVARIAGIGRVRTKEVDLRVTFARPSGARVALSVHLLRVNGSWRWVLPNARYASYRRGACE